MTRFRIYDFNFNNKAWGKLSEEELERVHYVDADIIETRSLLKKSKKIGNKGYLWKGKYLAIATFNTGEKRKILLSRYGGFLLDVEGKCFYEFDDSSRAGWDNYLQKYKDKLVAKHSN